jgi:uncharacterized repeat protein (TIGR03943 family)
MTNKPKLPKLNLKRLLPGLDVLALLAWGALLLKYCLTGQLKLLIHPNYTWLVLLTSIILLILGVFRAWQLLGKLRQRVSEEESGEAVQHITLFPPGWGSILLLVTAIAGFLVAPQVLASQAAIQRGLTEATILTQAQPQSFRSTIKPEQRSLIEWVRTLNVYPEPDAYQGQKANITGFVVYPPQLPDNYLMLARFIITCCAVDAYPVGIPVKLQESRTAYPQDTWLEVAGEMMSESSPGDATQKRQLVLVAQSVKKIPTPADPYGY